MRASASDSTLSLIERSVENTEAVRTSEINSPRRPSPARGRYVNRAGSRGGRGRAERNSTGCAGTGLLRIYCEYYITF